MVPGTAIALLVAGAAGAFLQVAVFDLQEQESIGHAGVWGYTAGLLLLAFVSLPGLAGITLGERARRLGERRGTAGLVVNGLILIYLVIPAIAFILYG